MYSINYLTILLKSKSDNEGIMRNNYVAMYKLIIRTYLVTEMVKAGE